MAEAITDSQLVARVRTGDRTAFDPLVQRHYGTVFAVAVARLRDPEAAEDLAQEVFLRLYLQIVVLRDGAQFGAWALRVTRNLATDWQRRHQRRSQVLPLVPFTEAAEMPPADPPKGVVEAMEREDESRQLWRQLDMLRPEEREMVLLHFMEGLTKREVAERLGIHPSTVGRTIDRALGTMRVGLEASLRSGLQRAVPLRPAAVAKTLAVVSSVAALPAAARAEFLGHAAVSEKASAVATAASPEILVPPMAKTAAGVALMGLSKTTITAIASLGIAILVGSAAYVVNERKEGTAAGVEAPVPAGWVLEVAETATTSPQIETPNENTFIADGVDLAWMLRIAWKASPGRIEWRTPGQMPRKRFKLIAPPGTDPLEFRRVMQAQVEKAWGIRVASETGRRPVWILGAPQGRPAALAPNSSMSEGGMRTDGNTTTVTNQGLGPFVRSLEAETGKPVFDETGVMDTFDYRWSGPAVQAAGGQLGLALTPAEREVELLVVRPAQ